ncbi:MAG: indolepyruvate ferredoxin oxidoreductase family protein, partial [Rhodospirillaceae bacterium]|nr:indolepyruvate ferredoxin oxidoreductase family protein [Rhodospirillaceae bacterium]
IATMIPVLNPADLADVLAFGLYGWALSRFSGCWVALKCISETMDSSASIAVDPALPEIVQPTDFMPPPGGLGPRWPDPPLAQEARLIDFKMAAVGAFARANTLDRVAFGGPERRIGIVAAGKGYGDVRQALDDLGLDEATARACGLCLYKVGLVWPLEPDGLVAFAAGLDELIVVEEKRAVVETQIKEQLYHWPADRRPLVVGKADETGAPLLPAAGELAPGQVALAIGRRLLRRGDLPVPGVAERVAEIEARLARQKAHRPPMERVPHFCSGCPHNTSTRVPAGSRALGGIGCHYMVIWMNRKTETFSQMGGEGAAWIGQAPFTETEHVFVNIGDGTYTHSGSLAIRAAVASGANITFKLLFNDAVAMTGGQKVEGGLTVARIARQLEAEGVARIVVVSEQPERYAGPVGLPPHVAVEPREDFDRVQGDLRQVPGVSVLIYDQTCATEKRRRRKRGQMPAAPRRALINERVCEGCGDCSVQSNCLSVVPVETEFGRKRAIDQSSCNADLSCLKGFCPSFVTVEGGTLRKPRRTAIAEAPDAGLPVPALLPLSRPYSVLVTGIGGTGVVTIGAVLGMAGHLDGIGVAVLDQIGLAQKYGGVTTHVRFAARTEDIHAVRIPAGGADLILGCDLMVATGADALARAAAGRTRAVVNSHEAVTGAFTRDADLTIPTRRMLEVLAEATGDGARVAAVAATEIATRLLGDAIATNLFLLGYAWQRGLVPVSAEAILKAVELNGVAVAMNAAAFRWGRLAAHDPAAVAKAADAAAPVTRPAPAATLEEVAALRVAELTRYQDARYAARYRALVDRAAAAEQARTPGREDLALAVARNAFKLMAYKDEYEVARLYADGAFARAVARQFDGPVKLKVHLAPPLFAERDLDTGQLKKRAYGAWVLRAMALLARAKGLRGTRWDPFGRSEERRAERRLIEDYVATVDELIAGLGPDSHALAVEIARVPEQIRGYGHVKAANIAAAKAREADLLAQFRSGPELKSAAE